MPDNIPEINDGSSVSENRLAHETSPYLLQHSSNPVDWYPWGDEAFERARSEDKPILLSIGYSACHWCHVMAHESFENNEIAEQMNRDFVNIKVDREERPDVDSVYMTFTQAMTGQGGWPMTVFLTPDLEPFYAGTYFPPKDGFGRPGFPKILERIREAWTNARDDLRESAASITAQIRETSRNSRGDHSIPLTGELPAKAADVMRSSFDTVWGGFGTAPKFPSPSNLEFLLMHEQRIDHDTGNPPLREMVLHTLRQMWAGGMYDHLGGGFARYSVDAKWLVPHFEKMLYDNAQLVRVYLHAFQLTNDPFFEHVVRETIAYVKREMMDQEGGFFAAQDADSEGVEGKFFLWTAEQIDMVLGDDDGALFRSVFGIQQDGNFSDPHHPELTARNVLSRSRPIDELTRELGIDEKVLKTRIESLRKRLFEERSTRIMPGLDDKILTSWNGLMLAAIAEAGRVLGDHTYIAIAEKNAAFMREKLWRKGRLFHTYKAENARVDGMLEDYAYYGIGLVELYRATGYLTYLEWARDLLEVIITLFKDEEGGGFFETAADGERLVLRQKPLFDAPTPSGNAATAMLSAMLSRYFGEPQFDEIAREVIASAQERIMHSPTGFGTMLQTIELLLAPHREVVIIGAPEARVPYERTFAERFLPTVTLVSTDKTGGIPLLENRDITTKSNPDTATAFVCYNFVCELPTTENDIFIDQLDELIAHH